MSTTQLIAHCKSFHASDEEDLAQFDPFSPVHSPISQGALFQFSPFGPSPGPSLLTAIAQNQNYILPIKHNEADQASLQVFSWDDSSLKRMGIILRKNTSLQSLTLSGNPQRDMVSVVWLCVGLESNQHIKELTMNSIKLARSDKLQIMAPFLANNPRLEKLCISQCSLRSPDVNFVSDQLIRRSTDSLEELDFNSNLLGDVDLDRLVTNLIKMRSVKRLNLTFNGIGRIGAVSLVALLESQVSNLEELNLRRNCIDCESALSLINALAANRKLKTLNLRENGFVTDDGWALILSRVLQLVCDSSSISNAMHSNHTLSSISEPYDPSRLDLGEALSGPNLLGAAATRQEQSLFDRSLGEDNANLLRDSFEWNYGAGNGFLQARYKIFSLHIRGDINLGNTLIDMDMSVMPHILVFFGYHEYWDAVYRIFRARPELLCSESEMNLTSL